MSKTIRATAGRRVEDDSLHRTPPVRPWQREEWFTAYRATGGAGPAPRRAVRAAVAFALALSGRPDGTCALIGVAELARVLGVSTDTVGRALRELRGLGWLVVRERGHRRGDGTVTATVYDLAVPDSVDRTMVRDSGDGSTPHDGAGFTPGDASTPHENEPQPSSTPHDGAANSQAGVPQQPPVEPDPAPTPTSTPHHEAVYSEFSTPHEPTSTPHDAAANSEFSKPHEGVSKPHEGVSKPHLGAAPLSYPSHNPLSPRARDLNAFLAEHKVTNDERENLTNRIKNQNNPRNLDAYLNTLARNGDLTAILNELRHPPTNTTPPPYTGPTHDFVPPDLPPALSARHRARESRICARPDCGLPRNNARHGATPLHPVPQSA